MDKTARHNFDHSAKKPFHFLISKNGEDFNFFFNQMEGSGSCLDGLAGQEK